ncbi:hypothetical protein B1M_20933, partial [Burkholderia sp. TJI49]
AAHARAVPGTQSAAGGNRSAAGKPATQAAR